MNISVDFDIQRAKLTDSAVSVALAQTPVEGVLTFVDELLGSCEGYNRAMVAALVDAIESRGLVDTPELSVCLADESNWHTTSVGQWLVAMLLERKGETSVR